MRLRATLHLLATAAALLCATIAAAQPPRLILQITVDQLRGDMLERHRDRFGAGGLALLLSRGHGFTDATHDHSNTETIVGHATLATGAEPAVHGMIGNVWFDRGSGEMHYNIEDAAHPLVGNDEGGAPPDLAHRVARTSGRSPRAMLARTFADALAAGYGERTKIFAVSIKDRGAVPMAGFAGKALWFSTNSGEFVSSSFYYKQLPEWVREWNARRAAEAYDGNPWTLLHDISAYRYGARDDAPWEVAPAGFGRAFPHPRSRALQGAAFLSALVASPAGDELLADFAGTLLEEEDLGEDEVPDYLSVSFSSNDYVGHLFGPESVEAEDELLRLDRTLADFLKLVDDEVGLERTLIVLSADHGAAEPPAQLSARGITASTILLSELAQSEPVRKLERRYGLKKPLVRAGWPPYFYLDRQAILTAGADPARVQRELAAALRELEGIAAVIPAADLLARRTPDTPLMAKVRRNFHPLRSGDLHIVADPGWQLLDKEEARRTLATIHGSPWRYDAWVPLIFAGPGIRPGTTATPVSTTDIAPTMSALLGVRPPSRASGRSLAAHLRK
ncbi:MAG TPA: alkaline phosphatase family protein [Candidatus Limnocylindrales bacterium]|nr:alkaline phosphatase family protein [Candidatus Limnocylindrales bacterium]